MGGGGELDGGRRHPPHRPSPAPQGAGGCNSPPGLLKRVVLGDGTPDPSDVVGTVGMDGPLSPLAMAIAGKVKGPAGKALGALNKLPDKALKYWNQPTLYPQPPRHHQFGEVPQRLLGENTHGDSSFVRQIKTLNHKDDETMYALENALLESAIINAENAPYSPLPDTPVIPSLPLGTPLLSHDPDVPGRVAEKAGKYVRKLAARYRDEGGREAYDALRNIHVEPGPGGYINNYNKELTVQLYPDEIKRGTFSKDVVAHEFQHAMDYAKRPEMFDDYPAAADAAPEYWSHPTEVRARAMEAVEGLDRNSRKQKQAMLPRSFMRTTAQGLEQLYGDQMADLIRLEKRQSLTSPYPFSSAMDDLKAQMLPFPAHTRKSK